MGRSVQQAAFQFMCHSEPVLTLVWESPPSSRLHSPKDRDCHASVRYFIAMTGNSGVGISPVQQAAFQNTCHSEPVLTLVWESPPSSRLHSPKDGDCHASVRYFIAMTWNSGVGIPAVQQAAFPRFVSFRTSAHTGVGISPVIETTFFYRWRLPRQFENWLAMTGNSNLE